MSIVIRTENRDHYAIISNGGKIGSVTIYKVSIDGGYRTAQEYMAVIYGTDTRDSQFAITRDIDTALVTVLGRARYDFQN